LAWYAFGTRTVSELRTVKIVSPSAVTLARGSLLFPEWERLALEQILQFFAHLRLPGTVVMK
jgi:hypothetical protein